MHHGMIVCHPRIFVCVEGWRYGTCSGLRGLAERGGRGDRRLRETNWGEERFSKSQSGRQRHSSEFECTGVRIVPPFCVGFGVTHGQDMSVVRYERAIQYTTDWMEVDEYSATEGGVSDCNLHSTKILRCTLSVLIHLEVGLTCFTLTGQIADGENSLHCSFCICLRVGMQVSSRAR